MEARSEPIDVTRPIQIHGVLVRVLDTGVLLIGDSGIGKSECALDLVSKGHSLIADDVVAITRSRDALIGTAPSLTSELLEIRGLGIINVRTLFGESGVRAESEIGLCVELRKGADSERIGNVMTTHEIAGRSIPQFVLPVSPGRNLATLVETAVRLFRASGTGADASDLLIQRHEALLNPAS